MLADWDIKQVIPCHFAAPIKTTKADFKRAFAFAYQEEENGSETEVKGTKESLGWLSAIFGRAKEAEVARVVVFPEIDMKGLRFLNDGLISLGLVKRNADLAE